MTCTTACESSFSSSAMLAILTSREMEVLLLRNALHVCRIDPPGPYRSSKHQRGEARDLTSWTRIQRVHHSSDPSARRRWYLGDPRTPTSRRWQAWTPFEIFCWVWENYCVSVVVWPPKKLDFRKPQITRFLEISAPKYFSGGLKVVESLPEPLAAIGV